MWLITQTMQNQNIGGQETPQLISSRSTVQPSSKLADTNLTSICMLRKAAAGMHAQNAGHPLLLDCSRSKLCTRRDPIELRGDERSRDPKILESKAPNN